MVDFILNGQATGEVATVLLNNNFDMGALRPFVGDDGRNYITRNTGKLDSQNNPIHETIVTNAPASLRFQDWRLIDEAVIKVVKPPLRAIGDLRSRGLEVQLRNGLGYTVFSYENASDISKASINMDPIVKTETDRPVFDIVNLPLPVIHKDFNFSARQVMASRHGYTPLDMFAAEAAAERVAEAAESLLLGVLPSYAYGGGTVYGYTNFPYRLTKTITAPTAMGWTPQTMVQEFLQMRQLLQNNFHYGPYMVYVSNNLDVYLDEDYSSAKGDNTLRRRIQAIPDIMGVMTVPFLQFLPNNPYTILMVEMNSRTIREVIALDFTTLQWPSHGGLQMNYKIMTIQVPQLRMDQNLRSGICHGSAASS